MPAPAPNPRAGLPPEPEKANKKPPVWLTCLGIGCLTFIVIAFVGGFLVVTKGPEIARWGVATALETGAEGMFQEFNLTEEEKTELRKTVEAVSKKIRSGEVDLANAEKIAKEMEQSGLAVAFAFRIFDLRYVRGSDELSPQAKEDAHIQVTRFMEGLVGGSIDRKTAEKIGDIVTVKTVGQQQKQLKSSLTKDEIDKCIRIMEEAADEAGVPNREFQIDFAREFQDAIDRGTGKKPAGGKAGQ